MSRIAPALGVVAVALAIAAAANAVAGQAHLSEPASRPETAPRSILWESKQAFFEKLMELEARQPDASRAPTSQYDVEFYDIDITVDMDTESIEGTVTIRAVSLVNQLWFVTFDLFDEMVVSSVRRDGRGPLTFTHVYNELNVTLDRALNVGEAFNITIEYAGTPVDDALNFATHVGGDIVYSHSEPVGAREWWPCKDMPSDKADSARIAFTVPNGMTAVSQGTLVSVTDNNDSTRTYEWFERYPISTYLVSITATNYDSWTDWYHYGLGDSMPITNYVYPQHLLAAQEDLNITADAIGFYASVYGEYPFLEEKYGHAVSPLSGAMEHQTCTSYGSRLIKGDHTYDWILVHELGHMWWGDWVTCATWDDIWLNEGFATYGEALWFEHVGGFEDYKDYMADLDADGSFQGSIYDPVQTFGQTVYDKGAWVLHMLRHVVGGRDALLDVLNVYGSAHAYGTAVTTDFISAAESVYGGSLDWFFQPWVYGENRPKYEYAWTAGDAGGYWNLMLHIDQVQTNAGLFTMPIDIVVETPSGDTTLVVWNDQLSQDFFLTVDDEPTALHFDPDNWILKETDTGTGVPEATAGELSLHVSGNPFSSGTRVAYSVPRPGRAVVAVYNVAGRLVARLADGDVSAGPHETVWDGTGGDGARVAAGVYFCRLEAGGNETTAKMLIIR
jgi:aminopeptidase N